MPATAGARTIVKQVELGELTLNGQDFSLKLNRSATHTNTHAHAAGSPIGRVPSDCKQKTKLKRKILCKVLKIFAADLVLFLWLDGAVQGEGRLACPLLIEAERIRLGGASICPQRIAADAPALATASLSPSTWRGQGLVEALPLRR